MKSVSSADVKNKKVLLRLDLNVPLKKRAGNFYTADDARIKSAFPTINYLLNHKAKVIVLSHLGRPHGRTVEALRMRPVANRLGNLLSIKVHTTNDCVGYTVKQAIENMKPGEVILLENLRFHRGEEKDDPLFAKRLAELGDLYVNDAFSNTHRAHASMHRITKFLKSYSGLSLEKEVKSLKGFIEKGERPLVVILGGSKVKTKSDVLENFIQKADFILLGGVLATLFLDISGKIKVSRRSKYFETDIILKAEKLWNLSSNMIKLPQDFVVAKGKKMNFHDINIINLNNNRVVIDNNEKIVDLGLRTVKYYNKYIESAKTIIWNGPMGIIEVNKFSKSTKEIAKAIVKSKAKSLVGGGDTISLLDDWNLIDKFTHVSTGGGAMDIFLSGKKLPGIEALLNK